MNLIELIRKLGLQDQEIDIEYHMDLPNGHNQTADFSCGRFKWKPNELIPIDYDFYDVSYKNIQYDLNDGLLTVWFKD